ncbi:hypothetical protein AOLI_G00326300 [Acnodon oligacanthus]
MSFAVGPLLLTRRRLVSATTRCLKNPNRTFSVEEVFFTAPQSHQRCHQKELVRLLNLQRLTVVERVGETEPPDQRLSGSNRRHSQHGNTAVKNLAFHHSGAQRSSNGSRSGEEKKTLWGPRLLRARTALLGEDRELSWSAEEVVFFSK